MTLQLIPRSALRRVGVIALLGLAACGGQEPEAETRPEGTAVGERAPALEGIGADSSVFRLAEGGGMRVLVFHQGVDCGLCRLRLQQLQVHAGDYAGLGAQVIAFTPDQPQRAAQAVEALALEYPLVSTDSTTMERWAGIPEAGGSPLPATYIVDSEGMIRYRHVGRAASDVVSDAVLLTELARLPDRPVTAEPEGS